MNADLQRTLRTLRFDPQISESAEYSDSATALDSAKFLIASHQPVDCKPT